MADQIIIPKIGSKGAFQFKEPFKNKLVEVQEYTVRGIRSLKEIIDSEENPLENIYRAYGLEETDMNEDLEKEIPIIVLTNSAGQYFYVPADRINMQPLTIGNKYQEQMLAINLGYLPVGFNMDLAKNTIKEDILNVLGITSTVESLPTSGIVFVDDEKHKTYQKLLASKKKVNSSYRIRYQELDAKYKALQAQYKELEAYIIQKVPPPNKE